MSQLGTVIYGVKVSLLARQGSQTQHLNLPSALRSAPNSATSLKC